MRLKFTFKCHHCCRHRACRPGQQRHQPHQQGTLGGLIQGLNYCRAQDVEGTGLQVAWV
jgi:hypothetical protein